MAEREELLSVVRAMAARLPIDWADLEASASDDSLRAAIRELRVISEIADLHHRLPEASPSAVASVPSSSVDAHHTHASPAEITREGPRETWGPFTLFERVGRGSFGEVYRAWDGRLDREIALKLLQDGEGDSDSGGSSIIDEGRLLARVRHPNVVTVHGADRIEGRVGLWMEFIHGRTLEQVLQEQGPLPPTEVAGVGIQICGALAAVHRAGLLHRDIKAQNVMRERDGRLVLMDFGAGRERLGDEGASDSDLAGTPLYLAPEIFDGGPASTQSDVYSVGVLLYHLLSGTYPVTGRSVREVRARHRQRERIALREARSDVPEALAHVVDRALRIDPADRFATADEMAAALAALNAPPAAPLGRRAPGTTAVLLAGIAVLGAAALAFNIAGARDRVLGRPGQPPGARGAAAGALGDRSFAVRQILKAGEYSELGRPSADGRYFPFIDGNSDLAVKELSTGRVLRLTNRGESEEYVDGAAAISADSRWIAYPWVTADHRFELRLLRLDDGAGAATQPRVLARLDEVEVYPVDWSEDGTQILALLERKDLSHQVALVATADGTMRRLSGSFDRAQGMSLSPDGRFVAYALPQDDNPRVRDIHVVATDGSGDWPLIEHPANDLFPLWAADGERVFFASDRTGALGLWAIRTADGHAVGEPEVISADMGRMNPLGVTRDGAFYYHVRTGLVDAYTMAVDPLLGTTVGKPLPVAPNYIGSNISSTWSPDGRYVAYVSIRSVARADRYSRTLSIRDIETGVERDVWPALAFFIMPQWSPDGRTVLVRGNDLNGRCCLQQIDVESGRVTHIALAEAVNTGHYQWTPDGRSIVFARHDIITRRDLATGRETELLNVRAAGVDRLTPPPFGRPFEISPDGGSLAFTGWVGQGETAQTVIEVVRLGGTATEIARSTAKAPMFFQGWTPDEQDILFTQPSVQTPPVTALWRLPSSGGQARRIGLEMVGLRDVHMNRDGSRVTFTAGAETGEVRVMENFLPKR